MGYQGEDNDVPVRSPIDLGTAKVVSDRDEDDYSTIVRLLEIVEEAEQLCNHIGLIDPTHPKLSADQQAVAYQFAYNELIAPTKALLVSAINDVETKRREQYGSK